MQFKCASDYGPAFVYFDGGFSGAAWTKGDIGRENGKNTILKQVEYKFVLERSIKCDNPYSTQELRPKTKFFNLLIYAGFPAS